MSFEATMSTMIEAHKEKYMALMRKFASSDLDARSFQREFFDMRNRDLREDIERLGPEIKRKELELIDNYQLGRISWEEFRKRRDELTGYQTSRWFEMFDEIFDETERCEPDKEIYEKNNADPNRTDDYITEEELRDKIKEYLKELDE